MGAYRSQPEVAKHSEDVSYKTLDIGMSGMQGWRMSMEDAVCCLPNFDEKGTSLFGVFDGHGGKEVADYVAANLHRFLMDTEAFQAGDIKKALKDAFLNIDEALTTEEVIKELQGLQNDTGLEDEDEDEAACLLEEANMPLGDLLERLKNSAQQQLDGEPENGKDEEKNGDGEKNGEEEHNLNQTNGHTKPIENGSKEASNPKRSRKPMKTVKRNVEDLQTDVFISSSSGGGGSSSGEASSLTTPKIAHHDDDDDPEYKVGDDIPDDDIDDEDEDEEDDYEGEEDDDDDDSDDEFEDSDGMDFQAGSDEVGKDSGTTAIVAVIHGNKLYVANVGDSRCVLFRSGKAIPLSTDHKPEDTEEFKRIENAGAKVTDEGRVNGGLNLSRALGDHVYKQNNSLTPEEQAITANPELREMELSREDEFLVLACDGIWNVMTNDEVTQFIKEKLEVKNDEKTPLSTICEELFDLCLAPDTKNDGSGCDNMTCMIVRFKLNINTGIISADEASEKRTNNSPDQNGSSKSKKLKLSQD